MAAVFGFEEGNIRIGQNFLSRLRKDADKRVVGRVQNESGDGDAIHHVRRSGARVIINCASKAAVVSCNLVIKFAQSGHTAQTRSLEYFGKQSRFGSKTATQLPNEIIFVEAIAATVQRVRG